MQTQEHGKQSSASLVSHLKEVQPPSVRCPVIKQLQDPPHHGSSRTCSPVVSVSFTLAPPTWGPISQSELEAHIQAHVGGALYRYLPVQLNLQKMMGPVGRPIHGEVSSLYDTPTAAYSSVLEGGLLVVIIFMY